jgi:hypothetical protein
VAKRAELETAIYDDPDFLALTGPARSVYIWSFTNSRTGQAGIYKVAREQIALETGFAGKQLRGALDELCRERFLFYDERVMFVRTKVKRIRTKYAETIAKSIAAELKSLGLHPFVEMWWQENENHEWATSQCEKPVFTDDCDTPTLPPRGPHLGVPLSIPISSVVVEEQQRQEEQLPSDFPEEIRPHLDAVHPALNEMARRHNAKAVSRYQVALTIKTRSRKPLVKAAHDCAAHWDRSGRPLRNVNAAYRNWLDRCDDLAGPEQLGATVHPLPTGGPDGRFSEYDRAAGL